MRPQDYVGRLFKDGYGQTYDVILADDHHLVAVRVLYSDGRTPDERRPEYFCVQTGMWCGFADEDRKPNQPMPDSETTLRLDSPLEQPRPIDHDEYL